MKSELDVKSGTGDSPVSKNQHGQVAPATIQNHGRVAHATCFNLRYDTELKIRQGAYLPHWTRDGATYAVTFRLGDSLPQSVLQKWQDERDRLKKRAKKTGMQMSREDDKRLQKLYSATVEKYLDSGKGKCWLTNEAIAELITDTINRFNGEKYRLIVWCIMPNHVHLVLEPLPGKSLSEILHSLKSYTAKESNKMLGQSGEFWQPEYYDHLIRDEEDFSHCCEYAFQNPEHAGLQNWPWRGSFCE